MTRWALLLLFEALTGCSGATKAVRLDTGRGKPLEPYIALRRTAHGCGLGHKRMVVERTLSWLHQFRKLEVREEHSVLTYKALADLALCLVYERLLES